jgi:hypothetical protein
MDICWNLKLNTMTEEKNEMPWDFWNHNINPILGYEYSTRDVLEYKQQKRNKNLYPPELDYKP